MASQDPHHHTNLGLPSIEEASCRPLVWVNPQNLGGPTHGPTVPTVRMDF